MKQQRNWLEGVKVKKAPNAKKGSGRDGGNGGRLYVENTNVCLNCPYESCELGYCDLMRSKKIKKSVDLKINF